MKYSDLQRIRKIYEDANRLYKYICDNDISREAILEDYTVQWLVTTPIYNIGEHAYNLSREYKQKHNDVPWNELAGIRHRLIHDYEDTNWNIVADALFDDLPVLIKQLKFLIDEGDTN